MTPEDWHILQAGKFASSRLTAYMEGMKSGKVEKKTKEELDWIWVAHYEGYREGYLSAKKWVNLTDDEIEKAIKSCNTTDTHKYFRAIEAKLREVNE